MIHRFSFHTDRYEYTPTWMVDQFQGGRERIWYCTEHNGHDIIAVREKSGGVWGNLNVALEPFPHYGICGPNVCDPTIVRGAFTDWMGRNFNDLMYYSTDDPANPANNGKINVAASYDGGMSWIHVGTVIPPLGVSCYGVGMPQAISANGIAAVKFFYVKVANMDDPRYIYRYSPDGWNFTSEQEITLDGLSLNGVDGDVCCVSPAFSLAQKGNYYHLVNVSRTHDGSPWGRPDRLSEYKIHMADLFAGTWQKIRDIDAVQNGYTEVAEPGFKVDAWGCYLDDSIAFSTTHDTACRQNHTCPYTWDMSFIA